MEFRLFDTIPPRPPTEQEISGPGGLLERTGDFYFQYVSRIHPNLATFTAELISTTYDPTSEYPIIVDFNATCTFLPGKVDVTEEDSSARTIPVI
jgi:hypothetical protein